MDSKSKYSRCTITGKTVWNLPYGMDEGYPDCVALKLSIANKIAELNANGVTEFFCNAEYGVSLFAAEAVIALRDTLSIKLNIIMPYEGQADKYSCDVRERFFNLHANADTVEILNTHNCESCYYEADMYMIDNSDILLTDSIDSFISIYAIKQNVTVKLIEKLPLTVF